MSKYFVNWRLLKSQAPATSQPVQSKASFKASSKHGKLQSQLRLLQALSSHVFNTSRDGNPATFQPCSDVRRIFFSISSEFPFIHPSFTSRTWLPSCTTMLQAGETALCPFPRCVSAWRGCTNAVMVHQRLHPPEWLRASPLGYFSLPVLFLLWESLEEHSTSHVLDRGNALAWLDLLSHPPSHSHSAGCWFTQDLLFTFPGPVLLPASPPDPSRWARLFYPTHGASPRVPRNSGTNNSFPRPGVTQERAEGRLSLLILPLLTCVSTLLCSKTTEAQHEPHNTLLPKASHESFLTFLTKKNNGEWTLAVTWL